MLPQLLLVVGALAALWLVLGWLKRTHPAMAGNATRMVGLGLLVVFGLWLVLTGKLSGLFALGAAAMPWIVRAARVHGLWKTLRDLMIRMKGGQAAPGGASQAAARFVRMELDHDSGRLDGQVLDGSLRGRMLSSLDQAEAALLWREAGADAQSARLLEAWLDRVWPDWRDQSPPPPPPEAPRSGMTREEAREILGIGVNAGPDEIRAAHRRLMLANHPDHGGSTWIAARINQARDLLLGS